MPDLQSFMDGPLSSVVVSPADALRSHLLGTYDAQWRELTEQQEAFVEDKVPRKLIRAGRRGGKTTGVADLAVKSFFKGRRVLYAGPTTDQLRRFWIEVTWILRKPLDAGRYYKNEGSHIIELKGTEQAIRAKTAWNAATLRGDFADVLILDEFQLMGEDTWEEVGQPMLADNDGDAIFAFTQPSARSRAMSKARDKLHASKMFKRYSDGHESDWKTYSFTSHTNPHISAKALERMKRDMSSLAYQQEIMAEDPEEVPGALWKRGMIDKTRIATEPEDLIQVVVGVDPPGGATECGIVVAATAMCRCKKRPEKHIFILSDASLLSTPKGWATEVLSQFDGWEADRIIGEVNFGGDMVEHTLRTVREENLSFSTVHASRGKAVRADPVVALYEHGVIHHVGKFDELETEMCEWIPGEPKQSSPNRMDAMVWAVWWMVLKKKKRYVWGPVEDAEEGEKTGE